MGNKLCKKKVDVTDNTGVDAKGSSALDRIITRLHLQPNAWKSDSHLNRKQANRCDVKPTQPNSRSDNIIRTQPLSKSSDWTEVDLEVPDKEEIHLRNPKLSLIFNQEGTPTPPPRKHKKNFNIREKIEAVAKSGLQAFQSKKPVEEQKKPVEEELCVKRKINYKCPICDQDETNHNRNHHHHHSHAIENINKDIKQNSFKEIGRKTNSKEDKRRKNLSVVSLPNYDELKLTVASIDIDKAHPDKSNSSIISLQGEAKKGSTGKLDNYITRCRSFGSLLPQQLKKLRTRKAPQDIESDDSFGGLEDWDLGLIEHYNPKDASLPRPRKIQRNSKEIMSDIENLVVKEEDIIKPTPPARRSESLVKKINREASESAQKTHLDKTADSTNQSGNDFNQSEQIGRVNITPPSSPTSKPAKPLFLPNLATEENGHVEHSSLMKILEQFSIKDKLENRNNENETKIEENYTKSNSNQSSLTPSLLEFEKNIAVNSIEDFINAEKCNTDKDLNFAKFNKPLIS